MPAGRATPRPARLGAGRRRTSTQPRLQPPDGSDPGRRARREARPPGGVDGHAARPCRALRRGAPAPGQAPRKRPRPMIAGALGAARLSHLCGASRQPERGAGGASRGSASRRACTIRSPMHLPRRLGGPGPSRRRFPARRARVPRGAVHPRPPRARARGRGGGGAGPPHGGRDECRCAHAGPAPRGRARRRGFLSPTMQSTALDGARTLVTGGAGLIGSHLADGPRPRPAPREIIVLDDLSRGRLENLAPARARGRVTLVAGDIRDRALLAHALQGVDLLFHLAAIRITQCAAGAAARPRGAGGRHVQRPRGRGGRRREEGGRRLVGLDLRHGRSVPDRRRTITRTTTARSTARPRPSTRGSSRPSATCTACDYVALRYFNVYGPRMDTHGAYTEVLIRWMERIDQGLPPVIFGDGKQTMDFVYVEDIARANLLAARVRRLRRGVQRRERRRDEPRRPRARAARGDGRGPAGGVRTGAQGQRGAAAPRRHRRARRRASASRPASVSTRACAARRLVAAPSGRAGASGRRRAKHGRDRRRARGHVRRAGLARRRPARPRAGLPRARPPARASAGRRAARPRRPGRLPPRGRRRRAPRRDPARPRHLLLGGSPRPGRSSSPTSTSSGRSSASISTSSAARICGRCGRASPTTRRRSIATPTTARAPTRCPCSCRSRAWRRARRCA